MEIVIKHLQQNNGKFGRSISTSDILINIVYK